MTSRRRVLRSGLRVSIGVATIAAAAPHALAFRIEEDGQSPRARILLAACETRSAHARQLAELIAQLEGEQGREKAVAAADAAMCPLCGCRLSQAAIETGQPPKF